MSSSSQQGSAPSRTRSGRMNHHGSAGGGGERTETNGHNHVGGGGHRSFNTATRGGGRHKSSSTVGPQAGVSRSDHDQIKDEVREPAGSLFD